MSTRKRRKKTDYPIEVTMTIAKWHPLWGKKGLLHDFNNGFALIEIEGDSKIRTFGLHAFEVNRQKEPANAKTT